MKTFLDILAIPLVAGLIVLVFLVFPVSEYVETVREDAQPAETATATIRFVGDVMLDRYIRRTIDTRGAAYVFGDVRTLLESADLTVGNLEGPITDSPSVSSGTGVGDTNNMRFTFSPPVASVLSAYGFDVVTIGNNHIRDFGTTGVESTKKHLTAAGIGLVGDPTGAVREPVYRDVKGIRIAFIAYNEFLGGDDERALQDIREAKRQSADTIVVLSHWGEEYAVEPRPDVRALAVRMKEAGADLIIGTHSHVIGTQEDIGNTRAYYSLGNFVFDQYWEESVRCGLVVTATITKKGEDSSLSYEAERVGMTKDGKTVLGCS